MPRIGSTMPRGILGYPMGHGARLRAERREFKKEELALTRKFESEEAGALARSRMTELERTETGATRRTGMVEAGALKRSVITETGTERRHLREFGPEGIKTREIGLRYGPGGYEEKRLGLIYGPESPAARQATTAASRLSEVLKERKREEALETYNIEAEALFEPYIEREVTETGKIIETTPDWTRQLFRTGRAMTLRDPKKGLQFIKEGLKIRKEEQEWLDAVKLMLPKELEAYRNTLMFEEGRLGDYRGF